MKRLIPMLALLCVAAGDCDEWALTRFKGTFDGGRFCGEGVVVSAAEFADFDIQFLLTWANTKDAQPAFTFGFGITEDAPAFQIVLHARRGTPMIFVEECLDPKNKLLVQEKIPVALYTLRKAPVRILAKKSALLVRLGNKPLIRLKLPHNASGKIRFEALGAEFAWDDVKIK